MTSTLIDTKTTHGAPILRRLPSCPAVVAEIGVLRGKLSNLLLSRRDGLTLHMVDHWQAYDPDSDAYQHSLATQEPCGVQTPEQVADNYAAALEVSARYGDRARVHACPSVQGAMLHHDASLDLAFIDADHSEQAVAEDIAAWWPKVKPGGWLGGHDYETTGMPTGVKAAVDAFASREGLPVELDAFFTWFIRKPGGDA